MQICSKDLPPWHFYFSAGVPSHLLSALTPPLAMMAFILSTCRVLKNASLSHFSYFRPTLACPWKSHSVTLILATQSGHCALNISMSVTLSRNKIFGGWLNLCFRAFVEWPRWFGGILEVLWICSDVQPVWNKPRKGDGKHWLSYFWCCWVVFFSSFCGWLG